MIIGRSKKCNVPISDEKLGKEHLRITIFGSRCAIVDLDTASGTLVNGNTLTANTPVTLNRDDVVEIGDQTFSFTQAEVDDVEIPKIPSIAEKNEETKDAGSGSLEIIKDNAVAIHQSKKAQKIANKKSGISLESDEDKLTSIALGDSQPIGKRPKRVDGGDRIPKPELVNYLAEELFEFLKEQKDYLESLKQFSSDLTEQVFETNKLNAELEEVKQKTEPAKIKYEESRTDKLDSKFEIYKNLDNQIKSLQRQLVKLEPGLKEYIAYFSVKEQRDTLRKKLALISQTDLKLELEKNKQKTIIEQKYYKELESQRNKNLYFEEQKRREDDMAEKREIQDEIKKLQEKIKKLG